MSSQFCGFTAAGGLYGLPVSDVQELVRPQIVTPVPLAAPEIAGLINLRGQVVPSIDLRVKLGLPPREPGQSIMNVVVCTPVGPAALVVDSVVDVIEADSTWFETIPDTVSTAAKEFIVAACKLSDRLLLILDVSRVTRVDTPTSYASSTMDREQGRV